jgi:hypothetical protein
MGEARNAIIAWSADDQPVPGILHVPDAQTAVDQAMDPQP